MSRYDYYTDEDWEDEFKDCPENLMNKNELRDQVKVILHHLYDYGESPTDTNADELITLIRTSVLDEAIERM